MSAPTTTKVPPTTRRPRNSRVGLERASSERYVRRTNTGSALRKTVTSDSVHVKVPRRTLTTSDSMHSSKRSHSKARSPTQRRTRNPEHREKIRNASSSLSPKPGRRTCAQKLSSSLASSAITKDLLDENDSVGSESVSSLHDSIRKASSVHYSQRDVRGRRTPLSSSSSRHGRRHRVSRSRRSSSVSPKDKETIRVIQFDCSQRCGIAMVHTNDVHSESSKNADVEKVCLLMKSDITIATAATDATGSLQTSFNSSIATADAGLYSDDKPLIDEEPEPETPKTARKVEKRTSVMGTFKAVSKLLATPNARRTSFAHLDKLKLATTSLHL